MGETENDPTLKARLVPLYFDPGRDEGFDRQLATLGELLGSVAEMLAPVALGEKLPEADAVILPQLLGEAYRQLDDFKAIELPILIVTSEFGTLSMWDWEIVYYLKSEGVETIAPYDVEHTRAACRALTVQRELRDAKFLVYQDNPGEGFQAPIFKRFYWWEDECSRRIAQRFGVTFQKKSFKELGGRAKAISDADADAAWQERAVPTSGLSAESVRAAMKVYLALKEDLDRDDKIRAAGINCLNESHFSDSTPCLAWSLLFEERGLIWGCEADTISMLTEYILHRSLLAPVMMTNLYPFLVGDTALKHERIDRFPKVEDEPENHILVAHCGYAGEIPRCFADEWTLREKVLAIVDERACAIDATLPTGPVTLAKIDQSFKKITVAEGELKRYVQFPGSDCLNGGLIKIANGQRLMNSLVSHHYLVLTGHHLQGIRLLAKVFDLELEEI